MESAPAAVPMLLMITTAQFGVHALGWCMAAFLFRRPAGAEGHFALFWLGSGLALAVYLLLPPLSAGRAAADLLLMLSVLLVHRGLRRFYRQRPPDRLYAAAAAVLLAAVLAGALLELPLRWRLGAASMLLAAGFALVMHALWQHGRRQAPLLVACMLVPLAALVLLLVTRATLVLHSDEPARWLVDAESRQAGAFLVAVFTLAGLFNLVQIRLVLGGVLERLLVQSRVDELTGVANRRGALAELRRMHERTQRRGGGYALLMIDIDHFKAVNDVHGHAAGDAALVRVACTLGEALRGGDLLARWGGEEFCVLLPRCDAAAALQRAEGLRAAVAASGEPRLTVSIGSAAVTGGAETLEQALARADAALYAAKAQGRDRVVAAPA